MVKIKVIDELGVVVPYANVYITQHYRVLVHDKTDENGLIIVPIESGEDTILRVRLVRWPNIFYKPFEANGNLYENLEVTLIEDK